MKFVGFVAPLLLALAVGCDGDRCESVCHEANSCGAAARPYDVECGPFCRDVDAFNRRAEQSLQTSCAQPWQEHLACWEKESGNLCNPEFTGCAPTAEAYLACAAAYCEHGLAQATPDPHCAVYKDDSDTVVVEPALLPF